MLDFLMVSTRRNKKGVVEVYPKFIIKNPSKHLMIRGGDFYAVWIEESGLWSTSEQDAIEAIDKALDEHAENMQEPHKVLHLWDSESGMIDIWHKYCQRQMRDSYHSLDDRLIFSNEKTKISDYASRKLPYPLCDGDTDAWNSIMNVLYSDEERKKIEWAIGAVVSGDSKTIQKFMVFYGAAGTGKSTVLNIIQKLFDGYTATFDAKALGSSNAAFALEAFRDNPLVAIQHDGDLSRIEDNTRLNSLVSHEMMTVNEKFKSTYANRFKCFLFIGTNKPVKITDAKSGLIRRLIDVSPTGEKLKLSEYRRLMNQIDFELGAIAYKCLYFYKENKGLYDDYIPTAMLGASNDFYNFVLDSWAIFNQDGNTTLKNAWAMYKEYCDDAKVVYPYPQRAFKEELKNYFKEFKERAVVDGSRIRNYYCGFISDKFDNLEKEIDKKNISIKLKEQESIFDKQLAECRAQYANENDTPVAKWANVRTKLSDIDTSRTHYVKVPKNHIVIDFDIKNSNGEKDLEANLREAEKFPSTYAETSNSGKGLHLHYIYDGDVEKLSRIYDEDIEIKVFTGNASLRRRLTLCNDIPITTINQGLPLKEEKKNMINFNAALNEKSIRKFIKKNLNKEYHQYTKPSIDFIFKKLTDAYESGISYDVSDMYNSVLAFAASSSNQADLCIKLVGRMPFKSKDIEEKNKDAEKGIVFFDVEVFPNLFLVNWKLEGKDNVVRMINPTSREIEELFDYKLVGFNCRRYDNHILYARFLGYSNEDLFNLSQRIVSGAKDCFFGEAYNISYTDIYDFASAGNKMSLKKWEIKLGIRHKELYLPWDKAVPEDKWHEVAEYCDNDVLATEAVFKHLSGDFTARQILADLAGMSINDTTNTLTTKIIFGSNRSPQGKFMYRDLAEPVDYIPNDVEQFLNEKKPEMMKSWTDSKLPYFKGYKFEKGISTYRGDEAGEGGYVYSEPGMYKNVALLDVSSMHPNSVISECLFGAEFTKKFAEIVDGRIRIKHEDWEHVDKMLGGKLKPYVKKVKDGLMTSKELANALKTAINSVYGLTSARFQNAFRDERNIDNIVAKRGALFMIDLKNYVQDLGYIVAHIKTDSIKIPDADEKIIKAVMDFGKKYGYDFEYEDNYKKMCLVNKAVYIAKTKDDEWTATGEQFAVPYVFKTLFSKENIELRDCFQTFTVTTALYLDMNESLPDTSEYETEMERREYNLKNPDKAKKLYMENLSDDELKKKIDEGHFYTFVGKVGEFCPVKEKGGLLMRKNGEKYSYATGAKGYRWKLAEDVKDLSEVDMSYFHKLLDDAKDAIHAFGDIEWFLSSD
ncbi:MAG: DUF5906 domain-containing protein [Eubacteriales bacterium]|nr:DUF5906 domain-containing protein [Eubacteriales bacterium]